MSLPTPAPFAATVTGYLGDDHRRLDRLLTESVRLAGQPGTLTEGATRFGAFRRGLERHIVVEEEILFPAFERASGMGSGGPTGVMRTEHVEIRRLLAAIDEAFAGRRADAVAARAGELVDVIGAHNAKEEQILYPMSDRLAGDEAGRAALVARMEAVHE